MVVTDGKVVIGLRFRSHVNKIGDAIVDVDLKTIADEACDGALLMLMKEDLKTTANEAYDDRKNADRAEADEDFIMIEAERK